MNLKKAFKIVVGAVLVIIGLQLAVLLIAVVWIAALNETNGSISLTSIYVSKEVTSNQHIGTHPARKTLTLSSHTT